MKKMTDLADKIAQIESESKSILKQFKDKIRVIQTIELDKLRKQSTSQSVDSTIVCKRLKCFPARELIRNIPDLSEQQKQLIEAKIKQIEKELFSIDSTKYISPIIVLALAYHLICGISKVKIHGLLGVSESSLRELLHFIESKNPSVFAEIMQEHTNRVQIKKYAKLRAIKERNIRKKEEMAKKRGLEREKN